jgi:hypothetical protein
MASKGARSSELGITRLPPRLGRRLSTGAVRDRTRASRQEDRPARRIGAGTEMRLRSGRTVERDGAATADGPAAYLHRHGLFLETRIADEAFARTDHLVPGMGLTDLG